MFDWKKFHSDLDHAMAILINEKTLDLPSKTSLLEFAHLLKLLSEEA